jgi:hypothetical protein
VIRWGVFGGHRGQDDVLLGVERLRTQAAVAVAACRRHISPPLWQGYFEIESRARSVLRGLRSPSAPAVATTARREVLETLRRPVPANDGPRQDAEARHLCERLDEVVTLLERCRDGR